MKQQGKLVFYKIFIILLLLIISCNKPLKETKKNLSKKTSVKEESNCFAEKDTIEIKDFYKRIKNVCKNDSVRITDLLTKNVSNIYRTDFCSMFTDSFENKDGKVEFEVLKNDCKGVININSVKNYAEDGKIYRNEYSLFLYLIKQNDSIRIDEIGGAG